MYKIAHFSDPHLGPLPAVRLRQLTGKRIFGYLNWVAGRKRIHQRGVLDALLKDLRRQRVDHVALTGDLVNISLAEEFDHASDWLATVGDPKDVTLVPGNHDAYVPMPDGQGHEKWSAYMASNHAGNAFIKSNAPRFPFVRKLGDIALIGLSSAIPTLPLLASGQLGSEQLSELPEILRNLGEKGLFRVLLIHHPPLPGLTSPRRALSDAHLLRDILASLRCRARALQSQPHPGSRYAGGRERPHSSGRCAIGICLHCPALASGALQLLPNWKAWHALDVSDDRARTSQATRQVRKT